MYRWLFFVALLLTGAASAASRAEEEPLPIMALPAELRERFVQHVLAGKPSRKLRLERTVDFVLDARGMGMRCQRFSMLVDDGVVKTLNVEAPGKFEVSGGETMLQQV